MKRTVLTMLAVVALLASLLPTVVFAAEPNNSILDPFEVEDNNVAAALQAGLAGQLAAQGQLGVNKSSVDQFALLFNKPEQKVEVDDNDDAWVGGWSEAESEAESGAALAVGNLTFGIVENWQEADADAGDVWVFNIAGDSKAVACGDNEANGGWAFSEAKDAEAEGGDAEAESGDSKNKAISIALGSLGLPFLGPNGPGLQSVADPKGNNEDGDFTLAAALAAAAGFNPAINKGDGGDAEAENESEAKGGDGGCAWNNAEAGDGGDATAYDIGSYGGVALNLAEINITGRGEADARSGDAYAEEAESWVSNCVSQGAKVEADQESEAELEQEAESEQKVLNAQAQIPVNVLAQLLAQVQGPLDD